MGAVRLPAHVRRYGYRHKEADEAEQPERLPDVGYGHLGDGDDLGPIEQGGNPLLAVDDGCPGLTIVCGWYEPSSSLADAAAASSRIGRGTFTCLNGVYEFRLSSLPAAGVALGGALACDTLPYEGRRFDGAFEREDPLR